MLKPPNVQPSDQEAPKQDDILAGLRTWSELTPAMQAFIVQAWMAGPYKKLSEFCTHYSLDYSSIYTAFSHPSRRLIENKKLLVESGVSEHEFRSHFSADKIALGYDRITEIVLHLLMQQALSGGIPLGTLLDLSQRLSTDRRKYGEQVILATQAAAATGTKPTSGKSMTSLLPPDLRKQVINKLAAAGEALVKKQESKK